jgi:hypothetical protein
MFTKRKLAIVFTVAAMCASTSVFAETRHRDATDGGNDSWRAQHVDRNGDRAQAQSRDQQQSQTQRQSQYDNRSASRSDQYRNRNNDNRATNRNDQYQYRNEGRSTARVEPYRNENRGNDNRSYDNRSYDRRGGSSHGYDHADGRRAYSTHGRVTRYERYNGGYRVWIGGGYPFYVSDAWWRLHHLRVGLDIVLGGYWNPAGYYDVYDGNGPYGYNTAGDLRGVVESVDYRRGTLVLRDDVSGSFVTTVLRGNDPRLGDLRPGDYVDLTGEWSRAGVFNAYNVADLRDGGRYDDRY